MAKRPRYPDPTPFYPAPGGARRRNYTVAESQESLTFSQAMCAGKYSSLFTLAVTDTRLERIGGGAVGVVAYPVGVDSLTQELYGTPFVRFFRGGIDGLSVSASVTRSSLVGKGFAKTWRYALGGLGFPLFFDPDIDALGDAEIIDLYSKSVVFWSLLTGTITVESQIPADELICTA